MSRSVSVASGAVAVAYAALNPVLVDEESNEYREFDSDDFYFAVEDVQNYLPSLFPSLSACDRWLGRGNSEDHALLENKHCYVGVSEYCGLVSAWVVPKEDDCYHSDKYLNGLSAHWCAQVGDKIVKAVAGCFGQSLIKQGTFSNGEAFFQPADGVQKGSMGLGFTSKEGWL